VYYKTGSCKLKPAAALLSAGVHKLSPTSSSSGKKPVCVSYIAIQRLGPSIWTSCHKKQGPQQLTWRPSRQDMLHIATGMFKVGRACRSCVWAYILRTVLAVDQQPVLQWPMARVYVLGWKVAGTVCYANKLSPLPLCSREGSPGLSAAVVMRLPLALAPHLQLPPALTDVCALSVHCRRWQLSTPGATCTRT
jgi:hypothetical protein